MGNSCSGQGGCRVVESGQELTEKLAKGGPHEDKKESRRLNNLLPRRGRPASQVVPIPGKSKPAAPDTRNHCGSNNFAATYSVGLWLGAGKHGSVRECWPSSLCYAQSPSGLQQPHGMRLACKTIANAQSLSGPISSCCSSSSSSSSSSSGASLSTDDSRFSACRSPTAVREVEVLRRLQGHPSVVRLHDVVDDASHTHIVMQLCQGRSLKDHIEHEGPMSEARAARVIRAVLDVLAFCHAQGIVHRDVKDSNFLFLTKDPSSPVIAIDFGLATFYSPGERLHEVAGSPCFVAPEVLRVRAGGGYGPKADVWSAGVLLYSLLVGRLPFDGATVMDVFRAVASAPLDLDGPVIAGRSPECKALLSGMLNRDVNCRPSARDLLEHEWVSQHCSIQ